ncbi:MJ0570-related uncharacterized domain-containing protein [Fervidobacterium gondwanense DSM 13020]|uniref:MJ0570-related uncharacterized domain-containing protein n=1 Tax=Fervidobacterium gondwanense DSM 13020 TaxID=1121883 RepID=A0A1M7TAK5_FERGO|nr:MJ0570-related uncharacterized domain-containing protein [Fervidobacterium gondwanense DSM 13020]
MIVLFVFASWSGGKDSALALYYGMKKYGKVDCLFTMLDEDCSSSRAHGFGKDILEKQALLIGTKLITRCSSWESYEENFLDFLSNHAKGGIGIFGDIDLQEHLDWVKRVCSVHNVTVEEPLWKRKREVILEEFSNLGFRALIVSVKKNLGIDEILGNELTNRETHRILEKSGVDICGENGEYHTLVYDGPIFSSPLNFYVEGLYEDDNAKRLKVRAKQL